LFAAMLVATSLPLPESWREPVPHALLVVTIVGVGWLAIRLVRMLVSIVEQQFDVGAEDNLRARTVHTQVRGFRNVASFVIAIVTLSFVLLTFDAVRQVGTGLLASAGIAGIVLGFAAQQSLSTLLAGIQIALTQPIRVDDVVIVEGEWGRIEEIRLTYVVVRVWDLRRLVLPIKYFIEQPFQNWTRTSADLLGTVILHLDYSVPIDELRAKLGDLLEAAPEWDGKTWGMQVTDASEQTMQVRALMSAPDASRAWDLRCRIREGLIAFVRERYPEGLPRRRVELDSPAREAS